MINENIYAAGTRFGLGLKVGEEARIGGAPQQWLMGQIQSPQMTGVAFSGLPSLAQNAAYMLNARKEIQQGASDKQDVQKAMRKDLKDFFVDEIRARMDLAVTTDTPFYERLVYFWSNHFAVSIKKAKIVGLVGAYEREAIRPHVTGRFADMLLAVAHSPAMLLYLDNAQSIGPDSIAGKRRDKGLNENLAREIMELHTLGVDGGYTQADVTTFAKVITGWSMAGLNEDNPGTFIFAPRRHEPGTQTVMGKAYPDEGEAQGVAVLRDLAAHPATARHIAAKLVRHFVVDDPPPDAVETVARAFMNNGGYLPEVYDALVALPQAWDVRKNPKIKSGYDLVISAARACGRSGDPYTGYCLAALRFLGAMPFSADSPAGMPDVARDIAGPEAMIRRVEWARAAANKLEPVGNARDMAALTLGPMAGDAMLAAMSEARHEPEAFAILFGSPEFQRR